MGPYVLSSAFQRVLGHAEAPREALEEATWTDNRVGFDFDVESRR